MKTTLDKIKHSFGTSREVVRQWGKVTAFRKSQLEDLYQYIDRTKRDLKKFPAAQSAEEVYKKLMANPMIVSVIVDQDEYHNEVLKIFTKDIIASDRRKNSMGQFEIHLSKNLGGWRMFNRTWKVTRDSGETVDHPHIRNGDICTGDWGDGLYTYDKFGHLLLLVQALLDYLRMANNNYHGYMDRSIWFQRRKRIVPAKRRAKRKEVKKTVFVPVSELVRGTWLPR